MSKSQFIFPNISIRSVLNSNKEKRVIIKGYAVAPNIPHEYMVQKDENGKVIKSLKSLFTENFVSSITKQMPFRQVFADALHQTAANISIRNTLDDIKKRASIIGQNFDEEVDTIMSYLKVSQFPLGKPVKFDIDDHGMYVEVELNPAFRDVDEGHKNYYDAVVKSLQNGNINTMSINFQATDVNIDDNGLERINDGIFYGVSFMPESALGVDTGITEVAIRSILEVRNKMENQTETKQEPEKVEPQSQTPPIPNNSIDEEVIKMRQELEALRAEKKVIEEKKKYEQMMEEIKKEVLSSVNQQSGVKGVVKTETQEIENPIKNMEDFRNTLKEMSWQELIQAQFETKAVGTPMAREMGILNKDADMDFNKR